MNQVLETHEELFRCMFSRDGSEPARWAGKAARSQRKKECGQSSHFKKKKNAGSQVILREVQRVLRVSTQELLRPHHGDPQQLLLTEWIESTKRRPEGGGGNMPHF